jgi:hypothetical protein
VGATARSFEKAFIEAVVGCVQGQEVGKKAFQLSRGEVGCGSERDVGGEEAAG